MLDALKSKLNKKIENFIDVVFVTEEEQNFRLDICNKCDKLNKFNFCNLCGCYMPAKTKLPKQECPLKKWVKIEKI